MFFKIDKLESVGHRRPENYYNKIMEKEFDQLLDKVGKYNPKADINKIKIAWKFAKLAHTDQKRLSGDFYIIHPLAVFRILVNWELDTTTLIAGLLHDTIEEGGATKEDIFKNFGEEVTELVEGVTKVTNLRLKDDKREEFIESLRKMILVMARDLRVVFIKLADRIHNLETLEYLSPENQIRNAIETLEIYAPLAERLDMGEVKRILEDLAFPYAYATEYEKVKRLSSKYYIGASEDTWVMKKNISNLLKREKVISKVDSRKKHLYSLWKKLERPNIAWNFSKVNDIVALRVLVNDVKECYIALGLVHSLYKPIPHIGISDFIAQPKPNGYKSIHTKVFGPHGRIAEVQIRTFQMHEEDEKGMSAHWMLSMIKNEKGVTSTEIDEGKWKIAKNITWVKQLVEWQDQIRDSEEFLKAVKLDTLAERILVFSPKGDIYDLPRNATPVDFACSVHTKLVNYIKSAKADGRIVPLYYQLTNGQVVEIIKSRNPRKPGKDWTEFVVTNLAKKEIRKSLELTK